MSHRPRHGRVASRLGPCHRLGGARPARRPGRDAGGGAGLHQLRQEQGPVPAAQWNIYHAPHFDVYYYDAEEPLLPRIVSYAESAYDELSRRLDYQIESSTPLIFYKTHSEFEQNNIQLGFIEEATGAFATDVRFRMVLPVDLPDSELIELIRHELTHIFQYHLIFGGKISRSLTSQPPTWLVEGMASYYGQDETTSDRMFLRDAVVNDQVPAIAHPSGSLYFQYRFGHAVSTSWSRDGEPRECSTSCTSTEVPWAATSTAR